jgi:tetratricopeptide (TPR) repeat protein
MNKNTIEYLAYLLNASKNKNNEKAIFFIGAGFSVSAGIPLTNVIVRHIKLKFGKNPCIQSIADKNNYYELMGALTADERRDLFHFYITRKKVKLNLASIYLAQLLKEGYIDYIVTVNFDDLILRASTLYNFLPPVYDLSNIKTVTTTDIRTGSVIYLHGQYFGQWLLNNKEELDKVEIEVANLFNTIKTRRTWVIIGYSGNDGIFEKLKNLGSFSSELFWVKKEFTYEDKNVTDFLETPNTNANKIEGEYADSFLLKLHSELSKLNDLLTPPDILFKPFTYLKNVLNEVKINHKDTSVSNNPASLLKICHNRLDKVIQEYEIDYNLEKLQQEIVDAGIKGRFSQEIADEFKEIIIANNYQLANEQLSWYYNDWGVSLFEIAKQKQNKEQFLEVFEKYKIAKKLYSKNGNIFNNWGNALSELAKIKDDEILYNQSFEKYHLASRINPNDFSVYFNWGTSLYYLAKKMKDESLYFQSFEKYKKANELNQKNDAVLNNWGTVLFSLAYQNSDEKFYYDSFKKFEAASKINSKNASVYNNWGNALVNFSKLKNNDIELFSQAENILQKAVDLGGKTYNFSCLFAIQNKKDEALSYLEKSLQNNEISIDFVDKDQDWNGLKEDKDFIDLIKKFKI